MVKLILKFREKRRILMIHIGTQKGFLSEGKDPPENKNQNHRHDRDDKRDKIGPPALYSMLFHLAAPSCMSFSGGMQTSISSCIQMNVQVPGITVLHPSLFQTRGTY